MISPGILAGQGYETDPHVTVMYGISDLVLVQQVRDALMDLPPFRVKFGKTGCFESVEGGTCDVVWVGVSDSPGAGGLYALRKRLLPFVDPAKGGKYGLYTGPRTTEDVEPVDSGQGGNEEEGPKQDSRPYVPHITLAYVQLGSGKQFRGQWNELEGKEFTVSSIVLSLKNGSQHEIPLTGEGRGRLGPKMLNMIDGYKAWDIKTAYPA